MITGLNPSTPEAAESRDPGEFGRFLPVHLLHRLAADPTPIRAPRAHQISAAALFADISGFTPLVERLAGEGAAGLEQLSGIIDAFFGRLIDVIAAHGGDVFNFAGDAVLALLPVTPERTLTDQARAAAQCGLALQEAFRGFEPSPGVKLALKVAVSAGDLSCAEIGGARDRWDFVLAGRPLIEIGVANSQAERGDVIVSPSAWALVSDRFAGEPVGDAAGTGSVSGPVHPAPSGVVAVAGNVKLMRETGPVTAVPLVPPPAAGEALERAMLPYIPIAVRTRLAAGQSSFLAEMRRVTVLFVNLRGLDHGMPLDAMHDTMRALQEALYHFEGSVQRLAVDDKGMTLVAALGLPPLAHQDDPLRGLQAAIAMRDALRQRGHANSIGVTTGRAFCGTVGSPRRCEYTMVGDVMNLAARLMMAGQETILCDGPTYEAAAEHLSFDVLAPLKLKGKANPVPVFQPSGRPQHSSRPFVAAPLEPLVGRAAERAALEGRLEELLRDGAGGVVVLEGEPGIGKSMIVSAFRRSAEARACRVLIGRADSIERSSSYRAWRGVFGGLLGLESGVGVDADGRRAIVLAKLGPDPDRLNAAPLLDSVLGLELPENDFTRQMTGEVRADNTHALLLWLLREFAKTHALVVIIEDIHWMDSASWALAGLVAREVDRVMLLLASRPFAGHVPGEYTRTLGLPRTLKLRLEALSPEETLAFVRQKLEVEDVAAPVVKFIADHAQGNPFFTEELSFALRDRGAIAIAGGKCTVAPGADLRSLQLPDTVQGVVTERIDRLTPQEQLSVKVASVVGRTFTRDILSEVHPVAADRPRIDEHLEVMDRVELTRLDRLDDEPAHAFKHVITQEVAYNLMLHAQRRPLHRAVAERYERVFAADLGPVAPLLAHHYECAGDDAKAIQYLERAGDVAFRDFANEEAITFLGRANALAERTPGTIEAGRRAHWEMQLGEAQYALGDLAKSLEHLQRAIDLAGHLAPRSLLRYAVALIPALIVQALHLLFPRWLVKRETVATDQVMLDAAHANERVCQIQYMNEQKLESMYTAIQALNLAERAGLSPELVRSYGNLTLTSSLIPIHPLAEHYARIANHIAEVVGDPRSTAYVQEVTGIYFHQTAQWARVGEAVHQSSAIAEKLGDRRRLDEVEFLLALSQWCQGGLAESGRAADALYSSGKRRAIVQPQVWGGSQRIMSYTATGQRADSVLAMEALVAECAGTPGFVKADEILGRGCIALAHLRDGNRARAFAEAEHVGALIRRSQTVSMYLLDAFAGMTEVALDAWEQDSANRAARDLASLGIGALRGYARLYPIGRPQTWLWRGVRAWLGGSRKNAEKFFARSLVEAERLGMPYDGALARLEIGRRLDEPVARKAHLDAAQETFARLGATRDVGRVPAS